MDLQPMISTTLVCLQFHSIWFRDPIIPADGKGKGSQDFSFSAPLGEDWPCSWPFSKRKAMASISPGWGWCWDCVVYKVIGAQPWGAICPLHHHRVEGCQHQVHAARGGSVRTGNRNSANIYIYIYVYLSLSLSYIITMVTKLLETPSVTHGKLFFYNGDGSLGSILEVWLYHICV